MQIKSWINAAQCLIVSMTYGIAQTRGYSILWKYPTRCDLVQILYTRLQSEWNFLTLSSNLDTLIQECCILLAHHFLHGIHILHFQSSVKYGFIRKVLGLWYSCYTDKGDTELADCSFCLIFLFICSVCEWYCYSRAQHVCQIQDGDRVLIDWSVSMSLVPSLSPR